MILKLSGLANLNYIEIVCLPNTSIFLASKLCNIYRMNIYQTILLNNHFLILMDLDEMFGGFDEDTPQKTPK